MFSKGADVDALRDSAGRMASFGREVDVVRAHGQRAVTTMERAWQGPDFQHLLERWRRVEHDLRRISGELDQLSRRLHDNADLQHRSSGSSAAAVGDGGSGAHHPGGGTGGGHAGGHGASFGVAPATTHGGHVAGLHQVHGAGWHEALVGWGPDGGRPLVTPGVPQPVHGMGWGYWIGGTGTGSAAWESLNPGHGPFLSAAVGASAAHQLGLPIR